MRPVYIHHTHARSFESTFRGSSCGLHQNLHCTLLYSNSISLTGWFQSTCKTAYPRLKCTNVPYKCASARYNEHTVVCFSKVQCSSFNMSFRPPVRPFVLDFSWIDASRCKTGRVYGDVPTEVSQTAAGEEFSWVSAYELGRSYQELEVCTVFPELQVFFLPPPVFPSLSQIHFHAESCTNACAQVTKDSSNEDRKRARIAAAEKLNGVIDSGLPPQRYLIAQRGFNFVAYVPENMKHVFKDPNYR